MDEDEQGRDTDSLMNRCWMSASKGGYEDMFSAAVQLSTELHKAHVQSKFSLKLEASSRVLDHSCDRVINHV